jgi:hypothetical protein
MWIGIGIIVIALLAWSWLFYEIKNAPEINDNGNIITKKKDKN